MMYLMDHAITLYSRRVPYIRLGDLELAKSIRSKPEDCTSGFRSTFLLRPEDVLVTKTGDEPRAMITILGNRKCINCA
jgi:hypothetical protein